MPLFLFFPGPITVALSAALRPRPARQNMWSRTGQLRAAALLALLVLSLAACAGAPGTGSPTTAPPTTGSVRPTQVRVATRAPQVTTPAPAGTPDVQQI